MRVSRELPCGLQSQELLRTGCDTRTVQELLEHSDVAATMICIHVVKMGGGAVRSPADAMVGLT